MNSFIESGKFFHTLQKEDSDANRFGTITNLPTQMFLEIRKYLSNSSYWKLITTAKTSFEMIRYESRKIYLSGTQQIKEFLTDENARSKYLEKINNPSEQLLLTVRYDKGLAYEVLKYPVKCSVVMVVEGNSYGVQDTSKDGMQVANLSDRKFIHLHAFTGIKDFDGLQNVEEMILMQSSINAAGLKNLYKLTLSGCNVTNLSCLGNLHELHMTFCSGFTSTSALGNVHYLELDYLYELRTLDPLTNHDTLIINSYGQLEDKSPLRGVRALTTDLIVNFQDCENLLHDNTRLQSISLKKYTEREPYPGFNRMKFVGFTDSNIQNLNHLTNVPKLMFSGCNKLVDITALSGGKTHSILFNHCWELKDYTPLQGISFITVHTRGACRFKPVPRDNNKPFSLFFQPVSISKPPPIEDMMMFSNTRILTLSCLRINGSEPTTLSFKGVTGLEYLSLKDITAVDIPASISTLELSGEDFHKARPTLENVVCPRIVLKERIYTQFMQEIQHAIMIGRISKDPTIFRTGPYEMMEDPLEKQVVLLKNLHYKNNNDSNNPAEGIQFPSFGFSPKKMFYHLFRISYPSY
jgi:hypothetical protein